MWDLYWDMVFAITAVCLSFVFVFLCVSMVAIIVLLVFDVFEQLEDKK